MNFISPRSLLAVLVALALSLGMVSAGRAVDSSSAMTDTMHGGGSTPEAAQVLVHLGHGTNDLHSAHMAMSVGTNLLKHGAKVTLFLDREGVRMADKGTPLETLTWSGTALADDYQGFVEAGGDILVCPGCAANAGMTEASLRPGATMGNPDSVAAAILDADKIIDY